MIGCCNRTAVTINLSVYSTKDMGCATYDAATHGIDHIEIDALNTSDQWTRKRKVRPERVNGPTHGKVPPVRLCMLKEATAWI